MTAGTEAGVLAAETLGRVAEALGRRLGSSLEDIWPALPYDPMVRAGLHPAAVAFAHAARDREPEAPEDGSGDPDEWLDRVVRDRGKGLMALQYVERAEIDDVSAAYAGEKPQPYSFAVDLTCRMAVYEQVGHDPGLADIRFEAIRPDLRIRVVRANAPGLAVGVHDTVAEVVDAFRDAAPAVHRRSGAAQNRRGIGR